MRSYHYLILSLVLFLCFEATAAVRLPLDARQDDSLTTERSQAPTSTRADSRPSSSFIASSEKSSSTPTRSERSSSTTSDTTASSTISMTTSTGNRAPTTAVSNESQPSNTAESNPADSLPIHPKITPAMGLTGVILLISGVVYAVIGIKNKWLYVFLSAAYLTSLSVTVLIIYLMSPPVSDAVQGAFFVAAILTGVIFGALSLVFSDITEGLGCLLGGFCLSMWLLTLKEGGLISSTGGRAIFIACMSVAGFSLSFSHYTRNYGLMVCISFAGATIAVLGIDCFSRAGMKEFWLYLWNLNPDIFPLNTNTYPISRGMKVEIAAIILFSIFGIISQIKLWKVVKERREKNAAARTERAENLRREEEELGRRIEDDFSRDRARWEATYGNKTQQQDSVMESSNRSTPKTSTSVREHEVYSPITPVSMEMVALDPHETAGLKADVSKSTSKLTPSAPTVTVTVLPEDDAIYTIDAQGSTISANKAGTGLVQPNRYSSDRMSSDVAASASSAIPQSVSTRSSLRALVPPPPVVVPLPFKIPSEDDAENQNADHASVSAVPESVHESPPTHRLSNRLSGGSLLKRFSTSRLSRGSLDGESLIVPHVEDDRASSLAATLDGEDDNISLSDVSIPNSPMWFSDDERTNEATDSKKEQDYNISGLSDQTRSTSVEPTLPSGVRQSLTISTSPKPVFGLSKRTSANSPRQLPNMVALEEEGIDSPRSKSAKSVAPSTSSQTGSQVGLSQDVLPERLSKVALSYRTNEWAKHLEHAEKPDLESIPEPDSPGVKLSHGVEEPAAPVSNEIKVVPSKRDSRRTSSGSNAYRNSNLIRSTSDMSSNSFAQAPHALSQSPVLEAGELPRTTSRAQNGGKRSSSTPFSAQTLDAAPARLSSAPSPIPNNTLMGQREALIRSKPSSQSFTPNTSSPNLSSSPDPENMTLAQRRQLIQHQKPPSAAQQWRQSNRISGSQIQSFDSHQPKRSSGGVDPNRREVMLASWRESMQREGTPVQSTAATNDASQRMGLMSDKRQKEMEKQQQAILAQQRESMMGNMMRSSGMLDAHREAMRRMQAKANKNAS